MDALNHWLWNADKRLSSQLNISARPGILRLLAIIVTRSGDALFPLVLMLLAYLFAPQHWRVMVIYLVTVDLLVFLFVLLIKRITHRARPQGDWGSDYRRIDPHSFPSGHAARGGGLAVIAIIVGPVWFGIIMFLWGVSVAFSRVFVGVHYFSDSLAGLFTGVMLGLAFGFVAL